MQRHRRCHCCCQRGCSSRCWFPGRSGRHGQTQTRAQKRGRVAGQRGSSLVGRGRAVWGTVLATVVVVERVVLEMVGVAVEAVAGMVAEDGPCWHW